MNYKTIDADVARIALNKIKNHLSYLGEELVGLSFYDKTLSADTLKKMVVAYKSKTGDSIARKKYYQL